MGLKTGLITGFGIGYVLGARAGRERYDQIQTWFSQLTGSPKFQQATEKTKTVAAESAKRSLSAVQEGVDKAGSAVKERLNKDDTTSSDTSTVIDLERGTELSTPTATGTLPS